MKNFTFLNNIGKKKQSKDGKQKKHFLELYFTKKYDKYIFINAFGYQGTIGFLCKSNREYDTQIKRDVNES